MTASPAANRTTVTGPRLSAIPPAIGAAIAPAAPARPNAAAALTDLTTLVPGDSWLYQLEFRTQDSHSAQVKFNGFAPNGAALVQLLEQSPQFEKAELRSSHAVGTTSNKDRVEVSVAWRSTTAAPPKAGS